MFRKIVVEIKSQSALVGVDWAQLMNYMKASGFRVVCCLISGVRIRSRGSASLFNHGIHGIHGKKKRVEAPESKDT